MTYICVYTIKEHLNVANFVEHLTHISGCIHHYLCVYIRLIRHINVVSVCKKRMHLWGPMPLRASRCIASHTYTTRMRVDKHTHAHTYATIC